MLLIEVMASVYISHVQFYFLQEDKYGFLSEGIKMCSNKNLNEIWTDELFNLSKIFVFFVKIFQKTPTGVGGKSPTGTTSVQKQNLKGDSTKIQRKKSTEISPLLLDLG